MGKTLLVFLFSDRVDSYINAIAHVYDHMQIDAVRLVYVKGTKTGLTDAQASTVSNQIWGRLEKLAIDKDDIYKRVNERLLDRQLLPLEYMSLKEGLEKIVKKQGGNGNCIIDLTGASKAPSIEVFSVCLALGIKSVYTFELSTRPDPSNPESSLYHSLGKEGYSYTCLNDTDPVKASQSALLRKSPFLWYVCAISLIVMVISLYILGTIGPNNVAVQGLNLAASIVGLGSPILALLVQRRRY